MLKKVCLSKDLVKNILSSFYGSKFKQSLIGLVICITHLKQVDNLLLFCHFFSVFNFRDFSEKAHFVN